MILLLDFTSPDPSRNLHNQITKLSCYNDNKILPMMLISLESDLLDKKNETYSFEKRDKFIQKLSIMSKFDVPSIDITSEILIDQKTFDEVYNSFLTNIRTHYNNNQSYQKLIKSDLIIS